MPCASCGQTGHNRRTCPQNNGQQSNGNNASTVPGNGNQQPGWLQQFLGIPLNQINHNLITILNNQQIILEQQNIIQNNQNNQDIINNIINNNLDILMNNYNRQRL